MRPCGNKCAPQLWRAAGSLLQAWKGLLPSKLQSVHRQLESQVGNARFSSSCSLEALQWAPLMIIDEGLWVYNLGAVAAEAGATFEPSGAALGPHVLRVRYLPESDPVEALYALLSRLAWTSVPATVTQY